MQWRSRGYLDRQEVVHDYSEQGCALVGLCSRVCEVGVRAGGVCELQCACEGRVRGVMSRCGLGDPR